MTEGRIMEQRVNPCRSHGCHACCVETRMTLTNDDVARLRRRGARDFLWWGEDGTFRLRTVKGRCVFLHHGTCAVYDDRPEGCRLYPLVLDLGADEVVCDRFCPFREEFHFTPEDERLLRESVAAEEREAGQRRERERRPDSDR